MKKTFLITALILLFMPNIGHPEEFEKLPSIGFSINSIDLYDVSAGLVLYKEFHGISPNIIINHNKMGLSTSIFRKSSGPIHTCNIIFLRPRFEYYFDEDTNLNFKEFEKTVWGFDLGVGKSGCSPLLNIFTGIRYETRSSEFAYLIGLGQNF